jgi:flavin reductase (DIM6/NTAB) family NADH-FMN oxidoreductase RutF
LPLNCVPSPAPASRRSLARNRDRPPTAATTGAGAGASLSPTRSYAQESWFALRIRQPGRYNPPAMGHDDPDPELFREVFGRFATGVAVITSAGAGGSGGMTANALCSLSLEPLLALVCFENDARTLPIVREARRFAVNVLSAEQEEVAGVFASKLPEAEKLDGVPHTVRLGLPIIDGTLAWAACELRELIAGGDHTIGIGEVVGMGLGGGKPLLWYGGRYHAVPLD